MTLQPGEFLDDPQSILDPSFLEYDSSNEDESDDASNQDENLPDCTLDIIVHHPNEHTWFLNQTILPPTSRFNPIVHSIPMKHDTIENDAFVWSVPLHDISIPLPCVPFTVVLRDYRERFRIKIRPYDLRKDVIIGHYLMRITTAPNGSFRITNVLLRGPLHHPPLMI